MRPARMVWFGGRGERWRRSIRELTNTGQQPLRFDVVPAGERMEEFSKLAAIKRYLSAI